MVKLEVGKFYKTDEGEKVGPMTGRNFKWVNKLVTGETHWAWGNDGVGMRGAPAIIAEWTDTPAEVTGENVRFVHIDEAPDELFERMSETRSKPYNAPRSKYHRIIKGVEVDIYDILVAWGVTCPARQHAIKKLFMAGERGAKGVVQDLDEAIQATERAKELV